MLDTCDTCDFGQLDKHILTGLALYFRTGCKKSKVVSASNLINSSVTQDGETAHVPSVLTFSK